jgi:hypothetical protein
MKTDKSIAYHAILAVVITEVVFAFSVGIICIVFSFNLFRTLKETPSEEINSLPVGSLPPSRLTNMRSPGASFSSPPDTTYNAFSRQSEPAEDLEMDSEEQLPGYQPPPESIFETFGTYLRWW